MGDRTRQDAVSADGAHLYWGDLHNHNQVGYAKGSLERSIDLAQEHLDFFAFTGHASWHDMPTMPGDRHMKWVDGFKAHSLHWPKTRQMIADSNTDEFVALLGYEWHSSAYGDYCLVFGEDQPDLFLPDTLKDLLKFSQTTRALAIPHHVAYKLGWRGANWDCFRQEISPVVEIFSEHGCTESDRSPFPMIRHSNGGRSTATSIDAQLKKGTRFGFVASTDDHLGYPGAYGEGVVGVWADHLSSMSLFDAVRARRTYAATGDRIVLDVSLNGQPIGAEMPFDTDREIDVRVEGQDSVQMVELVRNGSVIARHFPEDTVDSTPRLPGRAKCRIQYGWGPWAALDLGRICHWEATIAVKGGRLVRALGCFQSVPFGEELRDRLRLVSDTEIHLSSDTAREGALGEDPTKSIVIELEGDEQTVLTVRLTEPSEVTSAARLSELLTENVVEFTGVFTSESYVINRLVAPSEYSVQIRWNDTRDEDARTDWYYVRVTQHNGHKAWSSPIWVG